MLADRILRAIEDRIRRWTLGWLRAKHPSEELESELRATEQELDEIRQEHATLTARLTDLEGHIPVLKRQIERCLEAEVPAHAVPFSMELDALQQRIREARATLEKLELAEQCQERKLRQLQRRRAKQRASRSGSR